MFQPTTITVTFEDGTTETFTHSFESDKDFVRSVIADMIQQDKDLADAMSGSYDDGYERAAAEDSLTEHQAEDLYQERRVNA